MDKDMPWVLPDTLAAGRSGGEEPGGAALMRVNCVRACTRKDYPGTRSRNWLNNPRID